MTDEVLVRAEHICKYFKIGGGRMLHAVEDINLDIHRGETLGLVGESGCGKSTLGRTLMGIYQPTKGKLVYDGRPVDLSNKKDRFAFAKKAQIVFQDPYASLDPRMTVGSIIEEGMIIHNMYDAKRRQERVAELLATVGLNREHANRFPHEFSGGQRQRIGIARALAIEPEFIVCDEPISALDVSIQAQVINLLHDLQERMGADVSVHRARFEHRQIHLRPHRGDVSGQRGGAGDERRTVRPYAAPVLEGAAFRRADPRSEAGGAEEAPDHRGRRAQPN